MTGCSLCCLLFHDLQDVHGAGLDTDAAGDALGSRILGLEDHDLGGADLDTLAAGNALLLIDHVHAGLGILSDSLVLTDLSALAALDADHGLCASALCDDLDAGQIRMEFFIERSGASLDTLQTSHTLCTFFNNKLLHMNEIPFISLCDDFIIHTKHQNGNGQFSLSANFSKFHHSHIFWSDLPVYFPGMRKYYIRT